MSSSRILGVEFISWKSWLLRLMCTVYSGENMEHLTSFLIPSFLWIRRKHHGMKCSSWHNCEAHFSYFVEPLPLISTKQNQFLYITQTGIWRTLLAFLDEIKFRNLQGKSGDDTNKTQNLKSSDRANSTSFITRAWWREQSKTTELQKVNTVVACKKVCIINRMVQRTKLTLRWQLPEVS